MNTERWRPIPVDDSFVADPRKWLAAHTREDMPWLLVHADDGVIWGRRESDGTLKISSDAFKDSQNYPAVAVEMRGETIQQARLFGLAGELLVWRTRTGFAARLIEDGPLPPPDALPDEKNLLWRMGNIVEARDGFTLLKEGEQGLRHAPPVVPEGNRRPTLIVRHYVDYDDEGQAYISLSRLVGLEA